MISSCWYILISLPVTLFVFFPYVSFLEMSCMHYLVLLAVLYLILSFDLSADKVFRNSFILILLNAVSNRSSSLYPRPPQISTYEFIQPRSVQLEGPLSTFSWRLSCLLDPSTTSTTISCIWLRTPKRRPNGMIPRGSHNLSTNYIISSVGFFFNSSSTFCHK